MDRIRRLWKGEEEEQAYEPLENSITEADREDATDAYQDGKPGRNSPRCRALGPLDQPAVQPL